MTNVYVLCPDEDMPIGGVLKLYDFVDTLNCNHINSFIIHEKPRFSVTWFKNDTKVKDINSVNIQKDDLVILPEIWADKVLILWPGIRKIIYNQDSFNTFFPFSDNLQLVKTIYHHPDVVQVMVVSEYDLEVMSWLFPDKQIKRIIHGINEKLFYFSPQKKKQIAFMPRKGRQDFHFLDYLLALKNSMDGFTVSIIDKMSFEESAKMLRESAIFLSFSHKEGFGLPPAEAMACGCIVIGYHGQGGKEYFKKNLTFNIEQSDLYNYAKQVCNVIEQFRINPLSTLQIGRQASEYILKNYSRVHQENSILLAINHLIKK